MGKELHLQQRSSSLQIHVNEMRKYFNPKHSKKLLLTFQPWTGSCKTEKNKKLKIKSTQLRLCY